MTDWDFVVCDALEKVYPDADPRPLDRGIPLSAVLGEMVSFQVAFRPHASGDFLDLRPLRLRFAGDAARHVTAHRVELVPVELPAFHGHDDRYDRDAPGLYPDLLVPLEGDELRPLVGFWRAVWIDVRVDDAADAGILPVAFAVTDADGAELWRDEVSVQVLPVRLPELDIVNSHWLHADALADHYGVAVLGEEHWALLDRFLAAAAEMGVTSILTPVWTPPLDTAVGRYRTPVQLIGIAETAPGRYLFDFANLRRWIALCTANGIPGIEIAHLFTQWGAAATPAVYADRDGETVRLFGWDVPATDPRYRAFLEQLLPELCRVLDETHDRWQVVFHVSDEPHGEGQLASYLAAKAVVADLLAGRRIVDALSDHAYFSSGAVEIPVVATDAIEPFLADRPGELWAYYCVGQHRDVANRFIAMPSYRSRVLGHQLFAFELDGFLHWGFNYYYSWNSLRLIDPFRDTSAGGAYPGGDPFIVYPGEDGRPLPSIRSRVFAQAMWDHRAMQAVRDRDGFAAVRDLLDPDAALRFGSYSADPGHYLRVRAHLNARLAETDFEELTGSRHV
ncbi:hypothetical protein LK09_18080 [Microbacterium mangrovi]|uniref:Glycoside hydrolase 123 catalytic domain-containing protein n=1 Tax=Microbacterium mangrovi TaxID=1348253 RepID=A0A0B1ZYB5_9MICO|nr:DUF4091 domain-containing protein [Microbacterium mangrovi]KHK95741.1 hypothetical protein LK09_18080 [Microbacterium mangrovi]